MTNKKANLYVDLLKMLLIIVVTLAIVTFIIFISSKEPGNALFAFFIGPLTTLRRFGTVIEAMCPLIFTGLAVSIIFRAGQFSMISEGSFFLGLLGATVVGTGMTLPKVIHPIVGLLVAAFLGAIAAFVPAILKMKWGVNEVVTSIMLNYIFQFLALYIIKYNYLELSISSFASTKIAETIQFPRIIPKTNVHVGVIIALLLCFVLWFFLFRYRTGLYFRITGDNPAFAKNVGINVPYTMLIAQIIAGAVAGLGGGVEMLGMYNRFRWTVSTGHGWTGIVVALLAKNNPALIPLSALFIAYMKAGSDVMARSSDVSSDVSSVIQGVIMILIAANALLQGLRQKLIVQAAKEEEAQLAAMQESGKEA